MFFLDITVFWHLSILQMFFFHCSYILNSSSMVEASTLQFNLKALSESIKEVSQQNVSLPSLSVRIFTCAHSCFTWRFLTHSKVQVKQDYCEIKLFYWQHQSVSFHCRWESSLTWAWIRCHTLRAGWPTEAVPVNWKSSAHIRDHVMWWCALQSHCRPVCVVNCSSVPWLVCVLNFF